MRRRKWLLWGGGTVACVVVLAVLILRNERWRPRAISIQGTVIRHNADPGKELPIAGVKVTATDGLVGSATQSDASGYFLLRYRESVLPGQTLLLSFRNPGYEPLDIPVARSNLKKLYVARMTPVSPDAEPAPANKLSVVSNVRIRYTVNTQGDENIGSAVRTFQVVNRGNVPCNNQGPCSPDGLWKAAVGSVTLDAGPNNVFRDVRASCIAGPCPFARVDVSGFEHESQVVTARALDWSDTATFLLEAEVFRTAIQSSVRRSYPVIFGRTLNFTLPSTQEGVTIEAVLDGTPMVFPLGSDLYLSWANCDARANQEGERSTVYRCELKPGYRF